MHQFIASLKNADSVSSVYLVKQKNQGVGKTGKPYLSVILMDRTGTIDGRIWDHAEEWGSRFQADDYVFVRGTVSLFQNRKQLVVGHIEKNDDPAIDPSLYLPAIGLDPEALFKDLVGLLESIENPDIRWLALKLIHHPEIAPRYKRAPAARSVHHAKIGGLLEHSLSVVRLADFLGNYYPSLDRSYLVFGAAFHDFGKVFELDSGTQFSYTLEGKLVGHLVTGSQWIEIVCREREDFPVETKFVCQHLVLSHHGRLEYGSPKLPNTLEAVVLWLIDNLDSRVEAISEFLRMEGVGSGQWSTMHRFFEAPFYCPKDSAMDHWLTEQRKNLPDFQKTAEKPSEKTGEPPARKTESGKKNPDTLSKLVPEELREKLSSMVRKSGDAAS